MPHGTLSIIEPSPEIYQRIGKIAAEWSWIEFLLSEMLAHFCSAEHGAMYVITQSVSVASITDWLKTLVQIKVKDDRGQKMLLDLLTDVDFARAERNAYVHGNWYGHSEPGFATVQTFKWERSEVTQNALVSTADLDDLIAHLIDLQGMLAKIGLRLGYLEPI